MTHLNGQETEAAIEDFSRVIGFRPDDAVAHLNRGMALTLQGRYEEAIGHFDRAIVLDPGDADSWYERGMACIELGQYPEAIEDLEQAARLNPQHPFAEADRKVAAELAGGNGALYYRRRRLV